MVKNCSGKMIQKLLEHTKYSAGIAVSIEQELNREDQSTGYHTATGKNRINHRSMGERA